MSITVTFDPPLPSDSPSTFNTKAFTLLGDLNDWSTEANALASTVNSNASTSATNASNASNSADAAATSASNTAAIYDAFDDRYLGAKAVAPTLDNDGGALLTGALYFNTASNTMFVYTGSSWVATNASFAAPGPIGGTTPAAGTFTTLTSTGNAALGDAEASDTHAIKGATTLLANSASASLTVTQTGSGNAFVVEDSASTDSTPFVIDSAGNVGVGGAAGSDSSLNILGTYKSSGGVTRVARINGTIPSGTTSTGRSFSSEVSTEAASFTLNSLQHFSADQGTVGATSAITNQYGFIAQSSITGATNNYGFYSNIAAAANRYNIYAAGTADNYMAGRLGIGGAPDATSVITQFGTVTGGTTGYLFNSNVTAGSSVTSAFTGFSSYINTQATSFTLTTLQHFSADQGTVGATSAITNQYGFIAQSTVTGATNNYGFYSNIANNANALSAGAVVLSSNVVTVTSNAHGYVVGQSVTLYGFTAPDTVFNGTFTITGVTTNTFTFALVSANLTNTTAGFCRLYSGRYNVYAAGTAANYFAGRVGFGNNVSTLVTVRNTLSISGGTTAHQYYSDGSVQSDVTSEANYYTAATNTTTGVTLPNITGFYATQGTLTSTPTNQYGFRIDTSLTGATNNYGFYSNIASAANRYNFYANGTAANAFSGDVKIFGAGALGYSTGSGGTITQATSRTTGVTLNKTNGQITMFSAAGSATAASFTVTNSTVAATDTIVLSVASGTNKYMVFVTAVAAGSFEITFQTTGGTSTDAPVINFAVIKAASA